MTTPRWHGAESRQPWPWNHGQRDKEGEEASPASPGTRLCLRERDYGAGSAMGGVRRGREQAPGESRLI